MSMTQTASAAVQDRVEHVDVLIVGAGISGIGAAYHLREQSPGKSLVVLDALPSHGGTWWTHTYPGVRSDSDLFTFGYRFKPWRGPAIATSQEILHYLDEVITALDALDTADGVGALEVVNRAIGNGNVGHARIPGKHGAAPTAYAVVVVVVPDRPGALGQLFTDMGEAGVNLEDLHLEHGLGQPFGLAEVSVVPGSAEHLRRALDERGWRVHD